MVDARCPHIQGTASGTAWPPGHPPSEPVGRGRQSHTTRNGARVLAAAHGDDDGAIHGDDVNRAYRAAFVDVVARWSSWCRVVVGDVPGRRRHGGAGLRTCEDAA